MTHAPNTPPNNDLHTIVREIRELTSSINRSGATSRSTIRVDAGTFGVYAAVCACLCSVIAVVISSVWVARDLQRVDRDVQSLQNKDDVHEAYIRQLQQKVNQK